MSDKTEAKPRPSDQDIEDFFRAIGLGEKNIQQWSRLSGLNDTDQKPAVHYVVKLSNSTQPIITEK